jgi:4-amino-4-deoxy-L-arabinose transferase-like glycosyltransferase
MKIKSIAYDKMEMTRFIKSHRVDILFISFLIGYTIFLYSYVSIIRVPADDASSYLSNARSWIHNTPLVSTYRAPLISWFISIVWIFTGENWTVIQNLQPLFTLAAGIILYLTIKKHKGKLFAFGVSSLTLLNPTVFFWSTQIMTENISLFFLILSLYFIKSERQSHWFLAGIVIGLTFASRYYILIEAIIIFVIECMIRRNRKLATITIIGAIPIVVIAILAPAIKTGTVLPAADTEAHFTILLSPYYLQNSIDIWGLPFLLVPLAFIFRRTYTDKYNYTFIAWFIVSLVFWSAISNPILHVPRYTMQFTPAVYFLAILAIENITKMNLSKKSLYGKAKRFKTK